LRTSASCLTLCWTLFWAMPAGAQSAPAPKHSEDSMDATSLMPRYLLQDVRGRVVTQESYRGRFQLITFGFTSCPDVCPTTLLGFKNILQALGDRAERLQPLFITVDPERDSTELLREYTAAFDPRITGLTGSAERIEHAARTFRVSYQKVREPGASPGIYTMDHSTGMYFLDTEGRFLAKFSINAPAREITARIRSLMDADTARPNPGRRGNAPLR